MRIRSTRPEFWTSKRIASVSWDARLVLKALESYVDDNGVGEFDYEKLIPAIFPRDYFRNPRETFAKVSEAVSQLKEAGLLWIYETKDIENPEKTLTAVYISNWDTVQRIDKPQAGRIRRPDGTLSYKESVIRESVANSPEVVANVPESLAPGTEEQGNRGTGEQYSLRSTEVETRKEPKPTAYPEDFERFWSVYPAKRDKRGALKAFKEAKKRADVETIIAGAQRYAAWCGMNPERKIKYPQGWLSGDRWTDDLTSSDGGERFDPYRALANAVQQQSNFQPLPAGGDQWQ